MSQTSTDEPSTLDGGPAGGVSTKGFDDVERRQRRLWEFTMRARYGAIFGFAALTAVASDSLGDSRWPALIAVLGVVLPYNIAFDVLMRRRGSLAPVMAFTDQAILVSLLLPFEPVFVALLVIILALNATNAVAFGRVVARTAAMVGAIGAGIVVLVADLADVLPAYGAFLVATAFVVFTVGEISDVERDVRRRYGELMGGIDAIVWEQISRRPSRLYVNQRAEEVLGYPVAAWTEPGFWREHVHPDDLEEATRAYRDAVRRGEHQEIEYRMLAADGRVLYMSDRMRVERDALGRPEHVRGVMLDVTDERVATSLAKQYVDLVERISLALFVLELADIDDPMSLVVRAANPEATRLCAVERSVLQGQPAEAYLTFFSHQALNELVEVARTGKSFSLQDVRIQPEDAGTHVFSAYAFGLGTHTIGLAMHDVTDRSMAAEVLRRQALHDALTGLPNRTMLLERLRQAIRPNLDGKAHVALLVLDLNQFKDVNDALGHDHGDRLLIEMSRRLQRVLRDVDTIARLGGDEFAVLVTDEQGASEPTKVATVIREALEQPFQLGGIDVQVSAAIGIATFPEHGNDADALVQRADVAMYVAKRGGLGVYEYDAAHDQSSVRRLSLLGELRRAINESQLELHYQPSLDLRTGQVAGVEALVRWRHPEHGLVPPIEFIELAELSGLIGPLSQWVVTTAVAQAHTWSDRDLPLKVAVNLSVRNLYDPELVPWLEALLERDGIDPALLKIEVTESELMDDPAQAMDVLDRIRALGMSTSIDDFGTGYSSLAYLKHLPIDELKIDKSFVGSMVHDASDQTIVRSTIDLAHNLGLGVVAEGVEDAETLCELARLGCDRAQGYYISRPLPALDCTDWLHDPAALDEAREHLAQRSGDTASM